MIKMNNVANHYINLTWNSCGRFLGWALPAQVMQIVGANKGILVTTSGYGPDAFEFSKDKPIELLDGGQLLYLLEQVGVKAKIIFPEDGKTE
jgi:hypothetical protein